MELALSVHRKEGEDVMIYFETVPLVEIRLTIFWTRSNPIRFGKSHLNFCMHYSDRSTPECELLNTLRLRQNGRHFADVYKCTSLNENVQISITISWKFVPQGQINNIPALVQIKAWRRPGNKPLSGPMLVSLLTHICITWPHWINVKRMGIRFKHNTVLWMTMLTYW